MPKLISILESLKLPQDKKRIIDIGCGNGSTCNELSNLGYEVAGIDPSETGIKIAQESFPDLKIEHGSAYDDLVCKYGQYPIVISLEVVEHLYDPRAMLRRVFDLVESGGYVIFSTPYHGYWKNLALAVSGKMDAHFTVLQDDMHIKFFSIRTLTIILEECGFEISQFWRVGRIPPLAGSMLVLARKPQ